MKIYFSFILLLIATSHCVTQKKSANVSNDLGTVEFVITPLISGKRIYFDSIYQSPNGEKYQLKTLRFYLSNIAFAKSTGDETPIVSEIPTGVFLVDFNNSTNNAGDYKLSYKVKAGQYSDIRFDMGVPRELNHADPATAKFPLDLGRGDMYWEWNSGYIFLLAEGYGPDVYKNSFHFAVGSDARIMPFSFGNLFNVVPLVKVEKNKVTKIYFEFDFNKVLVNGNGSNYSFKSFETAIVHGGYQADVLRTNILNAFKFVSAEVVE
jgi:hypothetical protein